MLMMYYLKQQLRFGHNYGHAKGKRRRKNWHETAISGPSLLLSQENSLRQSLVPVVDVLWSAQ